MYITIISGKTPIEAQVPEVWIAFSENIQI